MVHNERIIANSLICIAGQILQAFYCPSRTHRDKRERASRADSRYLYRHPTNVRRRKDMKKDSLEAGLAGTLAVEIHAAHRSLIDPALKSVTYAA